MNKVKVLYDFNAQPDTSELSIRKDEVLTIIDRDIGEGWWEGVKDTGERGLFPAVYVEEYHENPNNTNQPEVIQPTTFAPYTRDSYYDVPPDINSNADVIEQSVTPSHIIDAPLPPIPIKQTPEEPDWPDEDWEDEEDSGDNATEYGQQIGHPGAYQAGVPYYGNYAAQNQQVNQHNLQDNANYNSAQQQQQQAHPSYQKQRLGSQGELIAATSNLSISGAGGGRIKRNTFSGFVKSDIERYILEDKVIQVLPNLILRLISDPELGVIWGSERNPYRCTVATHGKESKMKGLKTFISYDVRTLDSNREVRRRYKHFDWLMQRLGSKYIMTPLPPLPEKQIAGRFQEDFVEHRRNLLQLWVNYVTKHPVLSVSDVWWHFISCPTDDMKGWKLGKRKAEKDELVGSNFFYSVEIHTRAGTVDTLKVTKQLENFHRFVSKFDDAVKHLYNTAVNQSRQCCSVYSKDMKRLSDSIKELSSAFTSGTAWRNSLTLNEAIRQTSTAYEQISQLYEQQPKLDYEPMADLLHLYKGLLSGWPDILQVHKNAVSVRTEQERLKDESRIDDELMNRVNQKVDIVTFTTLAEINHFQSQRLNDFQTMLRSFLEQQINFYQDITTKLQSALSKVNDA